MDILFVFLFMSGILFGIYKTYFKDSEPVEEMPEITFFPIIEKQCPDQKPRN